MSLYHIKLELGFELETWKGHKTLVGYEPKTSNKTSSMILENKLSPREMNLRLKQMCING